ncbi:MAG: ketol-acid reductoisomerase [Acidimicrobiales bacterium]|nr:ketol-acid reductoisomerase [Acidimicrobiales bacterium]MDP6299079.1 ketol-acid reductoisomerase [Acidimicrobiales bacterium]HJM28151.1 ketol-acid reductoisomerase [Acidimicrobiales bacterium]
MANIYYEADADRTQIETKKIAVLGYGSQGHAHALNLKESGIEVAVGLRPESSSVVKAQEAGLQVMSIAEASAWANVVMLLLPDTDQAEIYENHIGPNLNEGDTLMFSHGFNIRFDLIQPPSNVDVVMVAPKGPGHLVRRTYVEGGGVPCLIAVENNPSGNAKEFALAYADAIGGARAGVIETTFTEECETDLFGEQVVLCGGLTELVNSGFNTLVGAGYQPEIAYFECLHELKLIVDLMYEEGIAGMRYSVSDTAEYGDLTRGPRVVDDHVRETMQTILEEIQNGTFAEEWVAEARGGRKRFLELEAAGHDLPVEQVGKELRAMMPWISSGKQSVKDTSGGQG